MYPKFVVSLEKGGPVIPMFGKFPGEIKVTIPVPSREVGYGNCRVDAFLFNSDDVMALVMLTNALRQAGAERIRLTMPYVPYGRQDRVCNPGEAFSIKAFAELINSLKFSSVVVYDAHSDVTQAVLDRCIVTTRIERLQSMYSGGDCGHVRRLLTGEDMTDEERSCDPAEWPPLYLVSPDAGARKKTMDMAKAFPRVKGIVYADKVRDVRNGSITSLTLQGVPEDIKQATLLVCDDICDGGRTFIELAKAFLPYGPKELNLYVTHGIFSQGIPVLTGWYNNVWADINFNQYELTMEKRP